MEVSRRISVAIVVGCRFCGGLGVVWEVMGKGLRWDVKL